MARRIPAEPKAALAGVMLETSFARLRVSMAAFSAKRTPSRLFGCLDFVAIVVAVRERCGTEAVHVKETPEPERR